MKLLSPSQVKDLAEVMEDFAYCLKLLVHKLIVVLSSYWQGHKVSIAKAITPNIYRLEAWVLCRHCLSLLAHPVPSQPASPGRGMDQFLQARARGRSYLLKAG